MNDPVLIASTRERCPASVALHLEGVAFILREVEDDEEYGRFLAENWQGEVIILEHDVVPWPGAIGGLRGCMHPWCVYRYPFGPGKLGWALGCLRVNPELVAAHPDLPELWQGIAWNQLDAKVVSALTSVSVGDPHFHSPALAHVKAELA